MNRRSGKENISKTEDMSSVLEIFSMDCSCVKKSFTFLNTFTIHIRLLPSRLYSLTSTVEMVTA